MANENRTEWQKRMASVERELFGVEISNFERQSSTPPLPKTFYDEDGNPVFVRVGMDDTPDDGESK